MELLALLVAAKLHAAPLATGLYRFEWKRAWVSNEPAPKVLVVDREDSARKA